MVQILPLVKNAFTFLTGLARIPSLHVTGKWNGRVSPEME